MSGWPTATLEDVAAFGSGGTPRRGERAFYGGDIPWAVIADLTDGVVRRTTESITSEGLAASSAKLVPAGSVLVAMYGSIGKLGLPEVEMATNQAIAFLTPHEGMLCRQYLFQYLRSQRSALLAAGNGGTQSNISQTKLKAWKIPLPPVEEQQRIAAILDHADALRAKRREALARLDELAQSIFIDTFGDGTPEWGDAATLKEISTLITKGTTPTSVGLQFTDSGIPFLRVMNLENGTIQFDSSALYIDEKSHETLRRSQVVSGDVLVSIAGTIGRVAIVPDGSPTMNCNQAVAIVRLRAGISRPYIRSWLQSRAAQRQISTTAVTATIANLSLGQLGALRLPIPDAHIQQLYEDKVSAVEVARSRHGAALTELDALFAALQSRAFRGEL